MISKLSAVLTGLLFSFSLSAQTDSIMLKKISDDILSRGAAYENLRFLCKKIGPRLSGSENGAKAVTETARMMREMGADTVYLQECMVPKWERGAKEKAEMIMSNGKKVSLNIVALGNSEGTPSSGVRSEVIEIKNFDELERMKDQVKGKIVFYNYPMNPTFVRTFMAYGDAGRYRGQGPSRAAKYGAIGVIVRSLASNPDDFPHTGAMNYNDSFPKIPAVAISTNDADKLSNALAQKSASQVYFKTNCGMKGEVLSHNVVGEIRGSELPDEILTVGGHIDSWDLAEGAHDDGAGCVQSMEVIRVFKALGIRPKRTIRAVMFQNEENGTRGGSKYAELAKKDGKKYIFAMESDAGGFTPRGVGVTGTADQKAKVLGWARLFEPYDVKVTEGGGGADIGPLRTLGTVLSSLNPDSQRYFDIHHASTDVFETVSRRELHLGAVVMSQMMWLVSEYGL
jgi:carboxypeptidase Q